MADFPVRAEKAAALRERLERLGVREEDLEESFIRSGGKGGQNVNKVATCVQLLHRPTGMQVKCQQERTQGLNRFIAREILADKLEVQILGEASRQQQEFEKVRRQKRKRSQRATEKVLEAKHRRSEVKEGRRTPGGSEG